MVFPLAATVVECEVTALQQVLQIALNLGLNRVVFESDCQLVVNAVLNNSSYMNELKSLLSNYIILLLSNVSYALAYIRRQTNIVAHNLARAFILHVTLSIFFHHHVSIHSNILNEIK